MLFPMQLHAFRAKRKEALFFEAEVGEELAGVECAFDLGVGIQFGDGEGFGRKVRARH